MKTHFRYWAIFAVMVVAMFLFWKWGERGWETAQIKAENVESLREDSTTTASKIIVSKREFERMFEDQSKLVKDFEKSEKIRVKQAHMIAWMSSHVAHDSVDRIKFPDRVSWEMLLAHDPSRASAILDSINDVYNRIEQTPISGVLNHPCMVNYVQYNPATGVMSDSTVVHAKMQIFVGRKPPKNWFWTFQWRKKNWPIFTEVKNDCGWDIKENFIFEIR